MQIELSVDTDPARAMLAAVNRRIETEMRFAMIESNSLLHEQVRDYPAPPSPIQGPAYTPVRKFTTRYGQSVQLRANRASGRGISMQRAADLRYKRTNTLYRSWSTVLKGGGAELVGGVVSNSNIAPYNRYVQDATLQAKIHQDRWSTVQGIARRSEREVQDIFAARIAAITGG
jgi:hypothetical protein